MEIKNWPTEEQLLDIRDELCPPELSNVAARIWAQGFGKAIQWLKSQLHEPAEGEGQKWLEKTVELRDRAHRFGNENEELKEQLAALKSSSFSASDMEGFAEWLRDNKSFDNKDEWWHMVRDCQTTSQLLTEYLNSPEYKNRNK
jgi:hypothetical protein